MFSFIEIEVFCLQDRTAQLERQSVSYTSSSSFCKVPLHRQEKVSFFYRAEEPEPGGAARCLWLLGQLEKK